MANAQSGPAVQKTLMLGQQDVNAISNQSQIHEYHFTSSLLCVTGVTVMVDRNEIEGMPFATITEDRTGITVAAFVAPSIGATHWLPPGGMDYTIMLEQNNDDDELIYSVDIEEDCSQPRERRDPVDAIMLGAGDNQIGVAGTGFVADFVNNSLGGGFGGGNGDGGNGTVELPILDENGFPVLDILGNPVTLLVGDDGSLALVNVNGPGSLLGLQVGEDGSLIMADTNGQQSLLQIGENGSLIMVSNDGTANTVHVGENGGLVLIDSNGTENLLQVGEDGNFLVVNVDTNETTLLDASATTGDTSLLEVNSNEGGNLLDVNVGGGEEPVNVTVGGTEAITVEVAGQPVEVVPEVINEVITNPVETLPEVISNPVETIPEVLPEIIPDPEEDPAGGIVCGILGCNN